MTDPITVLLSPHEIRVMAERKPDRSRVNEADERVAVKLARACRSYLANEKAVEVQWAVLMAQAGHKPRGIADILDRVFAA